MNEDPQITQILQEIAQGSRTRINQLIPLVYDELHGIAEKQMYGEHRLMTINPTAISQYPSRYRLPIFSVKSFVPKLNHFPFEKSDILEIRNRANPTIQTIKA